MFTCRLRAIDTSGRPVIFTPADVPVRTHEELFILANNLPSPLLQLDTVVRMMDHLDLGEGDRVKSDGVIYTVSYNKGFIFTSPTGIIIPSNSFNGPYEVLSIGRGPASRLQFKNADTSFNIAAFLGLYEGQTVTSHVLSPCDPNAVQVNAGFSYQRQKLYYGDIVDGNEVIMWHGRPCFKAPEGYVELPTYVLLKGA